MIRNSILYRRLWYVRKRSSRKLSVFLRLVTIIIILSFLLSYTNKRLMPCMINVSENKARSLITGIVNETVGNVFSESVDYNDIVVINKDSMGAVSSINTNVAKLNAIAVKISSEIQSYIDNNSKSYIYIPFGTLSGIGIFEGVGPDLRVKIALVGNVETSFKSEFVEAGINQTRHVIYIHVMTRINIIAPMSSEKAELITQVPVAETIIVGDVPGTYFNTGQ